MDHLGMPMREGVNFVHNALSASMRATAFASRGGKDRHRLRHGARHAIGADWCNSARGFMFSLAASSR